jgi:hypothetical protein
MSHYVNFHSQFRGLVERAMLSEIEDMIRLISEALARRHAEVSAHLDRASEALHAARRRTTVGRLDRDEYWPEDQEKLLGGPRFRIDAPPRSNVDIGDGGNLPV